MKILLASDLHLEFDNEVKLEDTFPSSWIKEVPNPDIIILAGDIGNYDIKYNIYQIHKYFPLALIVFVAGNHEYYQKYNGMTFKDVNNEIYELEETYDWFMFLNNIYMSFVLRDVKLQIFGGTMWSSLQNDAKVPVSDFYNINYDNGSFDEDHCKRLNCEFRKKLDSFLKTKNKVNTKRIVVTHFCPLLELKNKKFKDNELTNYFNDDMSYHIKSNDIDYWLYGHNHYNSDIMYHGTRVMSAQHGYYFEEHAAWKEIDI